MGISIKSEEVEALARKLAKQNGLGVTAVIHKALKELDAQSRQEPSLWEKSAPLRARIAAMPDTGLKADRAFYDDLSGEA